MEVIKLFSTKYTEEYIQQLTTIAPLVWGSDGMFCKELSELIAGRVPETLTIKFKKGDDLHAFKRAMSSLPNRPPIRLIYTLEPPSAVST